MDKIVQVTKQMTSEAFLYMNRSEDNTQETYGLNVELSPKTKEMVLFEKYLCRDGSRGWTNGIYPPLKFNFQSFHENQVFILNFILRLL